MYQLLSCVFSNIFFYVIKRFKCFCKFRAQNVFKRALQREFHMCSTVLVAATCFVLCGYAHCHCKLPLADSSFSGRALCKPTVSRKLLNIRKYRLWLIV